MAKLMSRIYREWQPEEGWLPLILIFAIASTMNTAVTAANWVPESGVISWTIPLGLILSIILAKRLVAPFPATLLLMAHGLATTIIFLGNLIPPLSTLSAGFSSSLTYIRQNLFLFIDRIGGWLEAVLNGESSEETIVFAIGLGLLSWFLITYTGWTTYRQQNPLNGLIIIGSALALNTFYGSGADWTLIIFVTLAVMLTAVIHMADMQLIWDRRQIDYPTDIRYELLLTSGGISLLLMAMALFIPAINIRTITQAFVEQPVVQQAEESFERVFAGVNLDDSDLSTQGLERGQGSSTLPRSFLIGNPPELAENLVMTATVQMGERAVTANWPLHWRAFSYDGYNGRGWSVSSEREEVILAGERLPLPGITSPRLISQSVYWQLGTTRIRYTMGLPLRFDHDVTVHWRGLSDLSQVRGETNNYTAESQSIGAGPNDLRQTNLQDIPDIILARYTTLPDDIPDRVIELAQEVAFPESSTQTNAYDQVKAIEQFLRQYPYSLDVTLPPSNQDLVDFFLFDLQSGYCDYYATSMVVLARSLGIPARFATGFLAQPPDENGVQSIYQLNAHSWAEVYFAGYGWVEFEPTAPFPNQTDSGQLPEFQPSQPPDFPISDPPPLPPSTPLTSNSILTNSYFIVVTLLLISVIGALFWVTRRKRDDRDSLLLAYGRLQKSAKAIGQPTPEHQTPIEFKTRFNNYINHIIQQSRLAKRILKDQTINGKRSRLLNEADELTQLFMTQQYSKDGLPEESYKANRIWQRIRLRLWLLSLLNKFRRFS